MTNTGTSHRLIRTVFEYAKIDWKECIETYFQEMPKLMFTVLENAQQWTSASNVYYAFRDKGEVTALDLVEGKREKIKLLSNLMMTMRFNDILEVKTERREGSEWAVFKVTELFVIDHDGARVA
jgi:hypothetical protein